MTDNNPADWSEFFERTKESTPHETLLKAIKLFSKEPNNGPRFAIDLGCGMGRDTFELIRNGWRVLACDKEQQPLDWLNQQKPAGDTFLETRQMGFEELDLTGLNPDLINASFTLPFCPADNFDTAWGKIITALQPGARFSGHFFGINDTWAKEPLDIPTLHFTRQQVEDYLKDFDLDFFEERDDQGGLATGGEKHWHVFHIVAQKK